jgi:mediator of RNA polymerase II transcription subunit 25
VPVTSGPAFSHNPSVPRATSTGLGVPSLQTSSPSSVSQDIMTSNENAMDTKPIVSMLQPIRPVNPAQANVSILNNPQVRQVMALSGGTSRGLQTMGQTPVAMHMSNMISSGTTSSGPTGQNVFSSGPSVITSSGSLTASAQVGQNSGLASLTSATSNSSPNTGISQPIANLQGGVSMGQQVPAMNPGNLSGAQMVQGGVNMNQNVINGPGQSGVSSVTGAMIPTPGIPQHVQSGMQSLANNAQQTASSQSKYMKVWEVCPLPS